MSLELQKKMFLQSSLGEQAGWDMWRTTRSLVVQRTIFYSAR